MKKEEEKNAYTNEPGLWHIQRRMSENIGFLTQSLPIKALLVTVCVEP